MKSLLLVAVAFLSATNLFAASTFVSGGVAYKVTSDGTVEVTRNFDPVKGDVVIPESVTDENMGKTYSVTAIGDAAFALCDSLTSISLPETITQIGRAAFKGCAMLDSIDVPSGVEEIPFEAFADCSALSVISLPETVTEIGMWAFKGCAMKKFTFPTKLTSVGDMAFEGCPNLKKVVLPSTCQTLGNMAFNNCTSLKRISLPASLTALNYGIINGCDNVRELTLPSAITEMNDVGEAASFEAIYACTDSLYPGLKNQTLYNNKRIGLYLYRDVYDKGIYQSDASWTKKFRFGWAVPISANSKPVEITQADGTVKKVSYVTLCRDFGVDFSTLATEERLHAYIASGVDADRTEVGMQEVKHAPAAFGDDEDEFCGLVIEAEPNKTYYYVMERPEANYSNSVSENLLVGVPFGAEVGPTSVDPLTNELKDNYGLRSGAFRRFNATGDIEAGKAYLSLPAFQTNGAKNISVNFSREDGTTYIMTLEELSSSIGSENYYDAAGVAHKSAQKGLNIYKGRKFVK